MKDEILRVLRESDRWMRLRELGSELGVWHCSLAKVMCDLEAEDKVTAKRCRDIGNMEQWIEYEIAEPVG